MAVKRWLVVCCGAALVVGACSSDDDSGSTTAPATTTGRTTAAPSATTTVAGTADPAATTTSVIVPITSEIDPNETVPPESTTTTTEAPTFEELLVQDLVQKGFDALPEGWNGSIADDLGTEQDTGFGALLSECAGTDVYDLADRDSDSAASWELNAEGAAGADSSATAGLTIEARKFDRNSTAEDAFSALTAAFSDDAARQCIAEGVPALVAGAAPPGAEFTAAVRESPVEGADLTLGLDVTLKSGDAEAQLFVDIAASNLGDGVVVFASFTSTFVPLDPEIASTVYRAVTTAS